MTGGGIRRYLAAAATLGAAAAGVLAPSPLASASSQPRLSEGQILRIAVNAAAADGDPTPTLIQHSEGTRRAANVIASGDVVPGSAWSYLIAERGTFIAGTATRPAVAPAPQGSVITLIVNAATGRVTDSGVSDDYPPLANLGPVTTDLRTFAACPDSGRNQLTSSAAGAASRLVPRGARQVLLCRYSGLNPIRSRAFQLLAQRVVDDRHTVASLSGEFDALKPFPSGAIACPADYGVKIIAIFHYLPTLRSDDPVTLDPNGCAGVTNGRLLRTAMLAPGPGLIEQLEALTESRLPPRPIAPPAPVPARP